MRAIDIFLRVLTLITMIGSLFLPDTISWKLFCATFFAIGSWSILFPSGIIRWAKTMHRELDPFDRSLWWIPRLIGTAFIVFSFVIAVTSSK